MQKGKTVLVTGFQPFGGQRVNPSWICVDMLPDEIEGCKIEKLELPVVWRLAIDELCSAIDRICPVAVLCVGQDGSAAELNIERIGINLCNGTDNEGTILEDTPIFECAPAAYFSTVPYKSMLGALELEGVNGKYSFSAGTYLCNHVLYGALHKAAQGQRQFKAGFLHVPMLPQQVMDTGGKCMPLEKSTAGVLACVREICKSA